VVFSVVNGLILRPLNVPQAESLDAIERGSYKNPKGSYPDCLDLRDRNRTFDDGTAYGVHSGSEIPSLTWGAEASGKYFDRLRIQPHPGRFFHVSDERGANGAPYIVLSYAYWYNHFFDDRGVVGR
jgi:macrolide transport system ATP-binding/permease protein